MLALRIAQLDSPIHRLNPLTKIILMIAYWATAMMTFDILTLAILSVISLCIYPFSKIPFFRVMKRPLIVMSIISIIFITINGFMFYGGETHLFYLYKWPFTLEGVLFGVAVSTKVLSVILVIPLLTMTTPLPKFMAALSKLKLPYKFVFTLGMAMRLVPLTTSTYFDILSAQRLRGHDHSEMNYVKRLFQGYVPLFVPLVLAMMRRSSDMDVAIESRGFGAPVQRTNVEDLSLRTIDYIAFVLAIIVMGAIIYYLKVIGGFKFSLVIQA